VPAAELLYAELGAFYTPYKAAEGGQSPETPATHFSGRVQVYAEHPGEGVLILPGHRMSARVITEYEEQELDVFALGRSVSRTRPAPPPATHGVHVSESNVVVTGAGYFTIRLVKQLPERDMRGSSFAAQDVRLSLHLGLAGSTEAVRFEIALLHRRQFFAPDDELAERHIGQWEYGEQNRNAAAW